MSRQYRFGGLALACALVCASHLVGFVVGLAGASGWVPILAAHPEHWVGVAGAIAAAGLLTLLASVVGLRACARVQPGTRGRGRLLALFGAGAVHAIASSLALALLVHASSHAMLGFVHTLAPDDLVQTMEPWRQALVLSAITFGTLTGGVIASALVASWFLLPIRGRRVFFLVLDVAVVAAAAYMFFAFPADPPSSELRDLTKPVIRLTAMSIAAMRLALRFLPRAMDGVERLGFRALVAARHLRAKKSNFLAAISSLSILAVAVSSCMLTTVLSVMGGFRDDLKQKILGSHAHVVVDIERGRIEGWQDVLDRVSATDGVAAATPVASGEVMVTSASNLAGAVLRGVDPTTVSRVSDLERNLVRGRLDYLTHPERLLEVTEAERSLGATPDTDDGSEPGSEPERDAAPGSAAAGSKAPAHEPRAADADLDRFLAEERDVPERDVLPGIIVGRELARTLRVVVGDDIEVVSPLGDLGPTGPIPKTRAFRVAGVFYSGMYEYDMKHVYVTLPVAQRFLNMGDAITGIEVSVDDVERAPRVARALERRVGRSDLRVQDWQELNKNLFGALALEKLAMFVTLGIAILIAGFCVFGTLTLMVQEKGREVGILKAMGTSAPAIIRIFLIEGLLIGLFGAGLGLALGFVVAFAAEHFGIRMNPEVYYIDRLPVHIDPTEFALVGLAAVVVCLLATVFPAYLASSTRPVDALRYD